jgi:hypothetical protein
LSFSIGLKVLNYKTQWPVFYQISFFGQEKLQLFRDFLRETKKTGIFSQDICLFVDELIVLYSSFLEPSWQCLGFASASSFFEQGLGGDLVSHQQGAGFFRKDRAKSLDSTKIFSNYVSQLMSQEVPVSNKIKMARAFFDITPRHPQTLSIVLKSFFLTKQDLGSAGATKAFPFQDLPQVVKVALAYSLRDVVIPVELLTHESVQLLMALLLLDPILGESAKIIFSNISVNQDECFYSAKVYARQEKFKSEFLRLMEKYKEPAAKVFMITLGVLPIIVVPIIKAIQSRDQQRLNSVSSQSASNQDVDSDSSSEKSRSSFSRP